MHHRYTSFLTALGAGGSRVAGESLLWDTPAEPAWRAGGRRRVAVDVGLTDVMGNAAGRFHPEVLVLTHDDQDHIGGWDHFAKVGLRSLQELWVPYEWGLLAGVVASLDLAAPADVVSMGMLLEGSAVVAVDDTVTVDEGLGRAYEEEDDLIALAGRRLSKLKGDDRFITPLAEALHDQIDEDGEADGAGREWAGSAREIAERATDRAHYILRILLSARLSGVSIRYFSVEHAQWHGNPPPSWRSRRDPVWVANAIEVRPTMATRAAVSTFAALSSLTVQNRRALCPVFLEACSVPTVFVWSDSSGEWANPFLPDDWIFRRIRVSTAPHHGSDTTAHDKAWSAMSCFLERPDAVLLLAGGERKQKGVHSCYLAFPNERRSCTRCRHAYPIEPRSRDVTIEIGCCAGVMSVEPTCR